MRTRAYGTSWRLRGVQVAASPPSPRGSVPKLNARASEREGAARRLSFPWTGTTTQGRSWTVCRTQSSRAPQEGGPLDVRRGGLRA